MSTRRAANDVRVSPYFSDRGVGSGPSSIRAATPSELKLMAVRICSRQVHRLIVVFFKFLWVFIGF